jgi:hypothetical protein
MYVWRGCGFTRAQAKQRPLRSAQSVYFFAKTAGRWAEAASISSPFEGATDGFGAAVAIDGT